MRTLASEGFFTLSFKDMTNTFISALQIYILEICVLCSNE